MRGTPFPSSESPKGRALPVPTPMQGVRNLGATRRFLKRDNMTHTAAHWSWLWPLLVGHLLCSHVGATALPDDTIVQRLPTRNTDATQRAALKARAQHAQQLPQYLPLALERARHAMAQARAWGDPRELGHAQAVLSPWWSLREPPPAVLVLKISILQAQHQFEAALLLLDKLLLAPHTQNLATIGQAFLMRADIHRVQGRWALAQADCQSLWDWPGVQQSPPLLRAAALCLSDLFALRGESSAARHWWAKAQGGEATDAELAWIAQLQAEEAALHAKPQAERYFKLALGVAPHAQLRAAYADWLLNQKRWRSVEELLAPHADAGVLLLRLAMARRQLGDPRYRDDIATLAAQFAAAQQRGDNSHAREQSLFALHLQDDPQTALILARQNWASQREPVDASVLIASSRAAGQDVPEAREARRLAAQFGWLLNTARP